MVERETELRGGGCSKIQRIRFLFKKKERERERERERITLDNLHLQHPSMLNEKVFRI